MVYITKINKMKDIEIGSYDNKYEVLRGFSLKI